MRLTDKDNQGNWCLSGVRWEQLREGQVLSKDVAERLYGALFKLMAYEDTGCSPDDVESLNDFAQSEATKLLQKLNTEEKKHSWIPVKERLPEEEKLVLVTCQTKAGNVSVNRAYYSNGFWHGSGSMAGVIAWMPLPEPYRAEVEEKQDVGADWEDHYINRFEEVK